MSNVAIGLRCLDSAGTLVLDVSQANGYEVVSLGTVDRTQRRSVVTADDVEGHRLQQAVLDSAVLDIVVRVKGSSQSQVETRCTNLVNAAERLSWRVETTIGGVVATWLADPADTATGRATVDLINVQRPVTLRIPVQPRTVEELA